MGIAVYFFKRLAQKISFIKFCSLITAFLLIHGDSPILLSNDIPKLKYTDADNNCTNVYNIEAQERRTVWNTVFRWMMQKKLVFFLVFLKSVLKKNNKKCFYWYIRTTNETECNCIGSIGVLEIANQFLKSIIRLPFFFVLFNLF